VLHRRLLSLLSWSVAAALAAPRDREALRAKARPHDWDTLAQRLVAAIERRLEAVA